MQVLLTAALAVGLFDLIYYNSIFKLFLYLLCFVSVVMLIISIDILSKQIMEIKYKLVNNFWFWFSSGSVLYNAFNFLIFGVFVFLLPASKNKGPIADIQHYANAICYLFFAFAIFKIPQKDRSSRYEKGSQ